MTNCGNMADAAICGLTKCHVIFIQTQEIPSEAATVLVIKWTFIPVLASAIHQ